MCSFIYWFGLPLQRRPFLYALSYLILLVRHVVTVSAGIIITEDMALWLIRSDRLAVASSRGSVRCNHVAKAFAPSLVVRVRFTAALRCAEGAAIIEGNRYQYSARPPCDALRLTVLRLCIARLRFCLRPYRFVSVNGAKIRTNFYHSKHFQIFLLFFNLFLFIETLFYK